MEEYSILLGDIESQENQEFIRYLLEREAYGY